MTAQDTSEISNITEQETDLEDSAKRVLEERNDAGLEGLVGDLDSVIIATEPDHLVPAVYDLLRYTGLSCTESFFDADSQSYVLNTRGSASVIVRSRLSTKNPFFSFNQAKMTGNLPNTRLETFIFDTNNLRDYVTIQKIRG